MLARNSIEVSNDSKCQQQELVSEEIKFGECCPQHVSLLKKLDNGHHGSVCKALSGACCTCVD